MCMCVCQAVERAKEIIAGLDLQKETVVVEEMMVGGNSKVSLLIILSSSVLSLSA